MGFTQESIVLHPVIILVLVISFQSQADSRALGDYGFLLWQFSVLLKIPLTLWRKGIPIMLRPGGHLHLFALFDSLDFQNLCDGKTRSFYVLIRLQIHDRSDQNAAKDIALIFVLRRCFGSKRQIHALVISALETHRICRRHSMHVPFGVGELHGITMSKRVVMNLRFFVFQIKLDFAYLELLISFVLCLVWTGLHNECVINHDFVSYVFEVLGDQDLFLLFRQFLIPFQLIDQFSDT